MRTETEIKLVYEGEKPPEALQKAFEKSIMQAGLQIITSQRKELLDIYYDTAEYELFRQNASLKYRKNKKRLILKTDACHTAAQALQRKEYSAEVLDEKVLQESTQILARSCGLQNKLLPVLTLEMSRWQYQVVLAQLAYDICLDFFGCSLHVAPVHAEVEIEYEACAQAENTIAPFVNTLLVENAFSQHTRSKYAVCLGDIIKEP